MLSALRSRLCLGSALISLLITAGCTTLENAYDSAYSGISDAIDGEKKYEEAPTKVSVQSPTAAPVQDVKAAEVPAPNDKPVQLGAISDTSANAPVSAPPVDKIVPQAPQPQATTGAETAANSANTAIATPATPPAATTTPETPSPTASNAPAATTNSLALLTIRFNQPHVYYEDALTQAVAAAQKAKSNVMYEVLSSVPDLSSLPADQQAKLSARAKDNLRNVVVKMQQQGVPAERIRIADQTLKIRSQEIHVYVR